MTTTLEVGTTFAGRYRVLRALATGGMGAVYEVVHIETGRRRALKVMHAHLFQNDEMRERFQREARMTAQIESEYIVDVSDAGVDQATKTPFMVMELLRGEELGDRLKRVGRLPAQEVMTYLWQIAWALDKTHAASIVHRDLKPGNVFLTQREDGSPRIKILDFGVAKLVSGGATTGGSTRSIGTPLYMAPEQFRSASNLTGAADIYSLALMTYTLLVGEPYWLKDAQAAGDPIAFALVALRGPTASAVQRAAQSGVALPPAFDAWFMRATAADPAHRFRTASEAVQTLGSALAGMAAGAAPQPTPPVAPQWTSTPTPSSAPAVTGAVASTGATPALAAAQTATSVTTSVGPAVAPPPAPSRGPLVAVAAVLILSLLGLGGWLGLRAVTGSRVSASASVAPTAPPAVDANPTATATATVAAATATTSAPELPPAVPTSAASASATPALPSAPARPVRPAKRPSSKQDGPVAVPTLSRD